MLFMFKTQPIQVQILIFILKNRDILNKIVLPLLRRRTQKSSCFFVIYAGSYQLKKVSYLLNSVNK